MIAIVIWDENTHFCHGIRILIDRISQQLKIPYAILGAEHADVSSLLFISFDNFQHYQKQLYLPCLPQQQRIVIISSRLQQPAPPSAPCLYHRPWLYREQTVEEARARITDWMLRSHAGLSLNAGIDCYRCPVHQLSHREQRFLSLMINNYSLMRSASIMQIDKSEARTLYQNIMQKLDDESRKRLHEQMISL